MKKSLIIFSSILLIGTLISCSNDSSERNSGTAGSEAGEVVAALQSENAELSEEITRLNEQLAKFQGDAESSSGNDSDVAEELMYQATIEMQRQYKEIGLLCNGTGVPDADKKIVLYKSTDPSKKVTITDTNLLRLFYESLRVTRVYSSEMVLSRYDEFVYEISYGDKVVSILVKDDSTFSIPKYQGKFFTASDNISQLGRAFLAPNENEPDQPTLSKMIDSALLLDETSGTPYLSEFNIAGLLHNFIGSEKHQVAKPDISQANVKQKLAFCYFGQKIYMTFYDGYIATVDGSTETWYAATDESIAGILSALSVP